MIKTCGNCNNESKTTYEHPCEECLARFGMFYWEAKEDDDQMQVPRM
jgi:hypothetical protein